MPDEVLGASFRDPSGFLFRRDGVLLRHVAPVYAPHYAMLKSSGLYDELVGEALLIPHEEVGGGFEGEPHAVLRPEEIPFVSYPYEWCFGQLKDAARLTLEIQRRALSRGMTLKDASAYNVQFRHGRPVFVDTLSFERLVEGRPWVAYRQFCQHFLAPLALMAHRDVRLSQLLRVHLDGIPLDLASSLLPGRAWWSPHLWIHLRVHARFQRRYRGDRAARGRVRPVGRRQLEGLVAALRRALEGLSWDPAGTEWADYREAGSYGERAAVHRRELVARHLERIAPRSVVDLGANTGAMSRLASDRGIPTLACDADPACVERSWREVGARRERHLLPLLLDLTNPSPAQGFAHRERESFAQRRPPRTALALALVHHLAISNNVPLGDLSGYFAGLFDDLVIEFVPKRDPKVELLLATREDVFPHYTREGFEAAFARDFQIEAADAIIDSARVLYRMRRRPA